jgi:hypothetical protein
LAGKNNNPGLIISNSKILGKLTDNIFNVHSSLL